MFNIFKKNKKPAYIINKEAIYDNRILKLIAYNMIQGETAVPSFIYNDLKKDSDSVKNIETLQIFKNLLRDNKIALTNEISDDSTIQYVKYAEKYDCTVIIVGMMDNRSFKYNKIKRISVSKMQELLTKIYYQDDIVDTYIVKKGKEKNQGIGYLCDGSMIIVNDGLSDIGKKISVKIHGSIKTSYGRMYFADKS
ncbi:hypothetical protein KAU43_07315 [candidate division WOR-3 bacterium]|nr:hypothetical protein [candidate division WOR-3 bacterium]